ncbi:MAG: ABC transporter permease [Bacteroidales bacterium]|nr:ABC transporter permease [Bacteroidales bacterium]
MLLIISWRNIWRNPRRSLVMIAAVMVGIWAGVFVSSLSMGIVEQRFRTGIEQHISHIQIHTPEFIKESNVNQKIEDWSGLKSTLENDPDIISFSGRTRITGMLATSNLTSSINLIGIDTARESTTSKLYTNIKEGTYFGGNERNPILIGKKLADKTKSTVGSRIVITFQNTEGELTSALFRVGGIYQTSNSMIDERSAYVLQTDIQEFLGNEPVINQVAIICRQTGIVDSVVNRYQSIYPQLTIRPWNEISPDLSYMQEMSGMMLLIILIIILFALGFGLLNTILMSVYERIRELGMLMAVGMNKKRVFGMILFETVFITMIGALLGMITGMFTIKIFQHTGIDFSTVGGDSLNAFGFESVVYPSIEPSLFLMVTFLSAMTAVLTAIYPALKALRLNPAEAVQKE